MFPNSAPFTSNILPLSGPHILQAIDTTLQGRPGNTITVPKWTYIGAAEDVAEGAAIPTTALAKTSFEMTIKKAGKGIELTDEALLSGYGDPLGEAVNQLSLSIADKIDNDVIAEAATATRLLLLHLLQC